MRKRLTVQDLGPALKKLRKEGGISLDTIVQKTGMEKEDVWSIENKPGCSAPLSAGVTKLLKALNIPLGYLLGFCEKEEKQKNKDEEKINNIITEWMKKK